MKVALVHHWLVTMRGGEKVLEEIAGLYPQADIFTLVYNKCGVSDKLRQHRIFTSWLNKIPFADRIYPNLLPLFPFAIQSLDLRNYDLVISSDASLMKGVRVRKDAIHICYCHSPPRYLWDMEEVYLENAGIIKRTVAKCIFPWLRRWDYKAAQGVDCFIANSEFVQRRIKKHYNQKAVVVYPPVTEPDTPLSDKTESYYLVAGQLVSYKRTELAIEAANILQRELVVLGEGPQLPRLKKIAGPTIKFIGWQPDVALEEYMARCRALIFPGEEDFGIVPVEAQLMGRPVIAFGQGGARETINELTGMFFSEQTPKALANCMQKFEAKEESFVPAKIRLHAQRFSKEIFKDNFMRVVNNALQ